MSSSSASPAKLRDEAGAAMRMKWKLMLVLPSAAFLAVFFLLPLAWSVMFSLSGEGGGGAYYIKVLTDGYYLRVLVNTLLLGLTVTFFCALIGYPVGYYIARNDHLFSRIVMFAVLAPLMVSIVMRSFGWVVLLGRQGLLNSTLSWLGFSEPLVLLHAWPGVAIALVHVLLPYMIISVATVVASISVDFEQAAQTLGANGWRIFTRVTFPLSLDGLGTGCILVFMLAVGGFVTTLLVGGDNTMTLPLLIYQQVSLVGDFGFASALGNILLVAAFIILYLQARLIRARGRA